MPVWKSIDPIRTHWLSLVIAEDFAYGVTNTFGKTEGASQTLLRTLLPLPVWYGSLVVAAVLVALGYSVSGGIVGMACWMALAVAAMLTIAHGTALSYGGPIPLMGWAWIHFLITYDVHSGLDDARERSQRRH